MRARSSWMAAPALPRSLVEPADRVIRAFRPMVRSSSTGGEPRAGSRSSVWTLIRIPPDSSVARLPPFSSAAIRPSQPPVRLRARSPEAPGPWRLRRKRCRFGRRLRRQAGELALRAGDGRVERRRRHRLAFQRVPRRPDLVADRLDELFRLGASGPDRLVAFPACAAALLVGRPQGIRRAGLGGPRPLERLAGLALGFADRASVSSKARWFSDSRDRASATIVRGEPEPLGDRECLAAARQPDRQPVRRRERLEVELDRGVRAPPVVWAYALSSA